ncbi:thiamine pyrophosphate-binding protein [Pseudonocardia sp. GCM10023141]|uniref:thiamine pyrophosphate-binding protein n=1 Tax=Pseudonocardia sp. GCM10023141 TaxID=3252653 RepID=UPI0036103934
MALKSGGQYLAEAFDAYGVHAVFLVPTILSRTLVEMEERTAIKRIVTHGEKAAVYMADGYARATGKVGVCFSQNIGASNLAAGLRDPFLGGSPVLAITGGPFQYSRGRHYYQEIVDLPQFRNLTKWSESVPDVERLPDMLDTAFRIATAGMPGPVHLEFEGHAGKQLDTAEFDAPEIVAGTRCVPAVRTAIEPGALADAVARLRAARRPVIVAGGGVRWSGAGSELLAVAEALGAPVATSMNAKDVFPALHPLAVGVPGLYSRPSANQALLEADLVLYVGSQTGSQVTLMWSVPELSTPVIHLDIDPTRPGRHFKDSVALVADAKVGLSQLAAELRRDAGDSRDEWAARAAQLVERWRSEVADHVTADAVPMRPERLMAELTDCLPHDAIVVTDTGHSGMWTGGYLDLLHPGQSYLRAAGSLGWGLPAAIGAQIGQPERPVVLVTGDGGLWYHIGELETAARWNIPLVVVVNNNKALNQEIHNYTLAYGGELHGRHHELWHFHDVSLAGVANAMGVLGITVEKAADLPSAIDRALSTNGPVLVEALTDIEALAPPGSAARAPR